MTEKDNKLSRILIKHVIKQGHETKAQYTTM